MKFANFVSSLLDLAPRDASGNIVLQGATAEQRLNVEELAIFSTIDLIASAASLCVYRLCKLLRREVPCHVKDILRKETY